MGINISDLRKLCSENKIIWREHALKRLKERNIKRADIKQIISNGEIIEQYPTDYPFESCLIVGNDTNNFVLHTVCSNGIEFICIITAYYPDPTKWSNAFRTRIKEI